MPRSEQGEQKSTFKKLSEGVHEFEIYDIAKETVSTAKSYYRIWKLNTFEDGEVQQIWKNMFPWQEVILLEALGYKKDENGGIDWEIEDLVGKKRFKADVYYKHDKEKDKDFIEFRSVSPVKEDDTEIPF